MTRGSKLLSDIYQLQPHDRLECFLGPSALISVIAERDLLYFSKSSKMLSPVAIRVLSKMQSVKDGLG